MSEPACLPSRSGGAASSSRRPESSCPLVRFLAKHETARRAFAAASQSRLVDRVLGFVAWSLLTWRRNTPIDYRALVSSCSCHGPDFDPAAREHIDQQFLCGIMARDSLQAKLPQFLQSLETLDFGVRVGLLKTWLHGSLFQSTLREVASFLGSPATPIDAMVAPFGRCNLACRGCYAAGELGQESTSPERLDKIVGQLERLHVLHLLLIGKGEPFFDDRSRRCLFHAVRRRPQMFFSVYSNGTTVTDADLRQLGTMPNLIPIFSLDGPEEVNDRRRGLGVYRKVIDTMRRMQDRGLLFGYISTVFRQNRDAVLDRQFVERMISLGCRLGYYSLFITPDESAADAATRDMTLDTYERTDYFRRFEQLDAETPIPLIDIDGIESHTGCRARRGATVYVDALTGQVSPCIRAPRNWPDCNLYEPGRRGHLADILQSEPFCRYRADQTDLVTCEAFLRVEPLRKAPSLEPIA